MKFIDLHIHSNVSDGTLRPAEVVALAKAKGLSALTLSDHESIAGNEEAAAAASRAGIEFIPGMEMSVDYKDRKLHIVALGFDAEHPEFRKLYQKIRSIKEGKIQQIIEGIRARNIDISEEKVRPYMVVNKIDRYAIMRYLVSLGICNTVQPLWDKYINPVVSEVGLDYNVTAAEALPAIRAAGGMTSLAHFHKRLGLQGLTREQQAAALGDLQSLGLDGMERYYPSYSEDDGLFVEAMLQKYAFLATGGTDFHGGNRAGVEIGSGVDNNMAVPYRFYQQICRYCQG